MTDRQPDFYEDDEALEDILAILSRAPVGYTAEPSTAAAIGVFQVRLIEHFPAVTHRSSELGNDTYVAPPERAQLSA